MVGQNFDLYFKKIKITPKPMKPIVLRVYLGLNIKGSNFVYIFHYFTSKNPTEIVTSPWNADIAIFEYHLDIAEGAPTDIPIICLSKFGAINVSDGSYATCLPRDKKPMIVHTDSYLVAVEQLEIAMQAVRLKAQIHQQL